VRILAAVPSQALAVLDQAFGKGAVLLPAHTMEEAVTLASTGIDAILCGVHFDESRMFDLLRTIKANSALKDLPFICVRLVGMNLAPAITQSLEISCTALGATKFVDFYLLEREFGSNAFNELARIIQSSIPRRHSH
jgi:CheY-like chemotaxis protein